MIEKYHQKVAISYQRRSDHSGFKRISAARAWACKPSPCANTEAICPKDWAPASETSIRLLRFWKSYTPKGEENLAVPEVGSTWLGPAQ
jgi:hypothetical protein